MEAQLLDGKLRQFWAVVMVTRAVAAMSAPRRRRLATQNIMKIRKATTLKSTVAVTRFKRGNSTRPKKQKLEFSFSSLLNGFGEFLFHFFLQNEFVQENSKELPMLKISTAIRKMMRLKSRS